MKWEELELWKYMLFICCFCLKTGFPFVLTQKQMISTSEWRAEHLFAGQNTQQVYVHVLSAQQMQ